MQHCPLPFSLKWLYWSILFAFVAIDRNPQEALTSQTWQLMWLWSMWSESMGPPVYIQSTFRTFTTDLQGQGEAFGIQGKPKALAYHSAQLTPTQPENNNLLVQGTMSRCFSSIFVETHKIISMVSTRCAPILGDKTVTKHKANKSKKQVTKCDLTCLGKHYQTNNVKSTNGKQQTNTKRQIIVI